MASLWPLSAVMLLLLFPAAAWCRDRDLPPPDPHGLWRTIGPDDQTTTSRCIGQSTTPLCALETFLACGVRKDRALCDLVTDTKNFAPEWFGDDLEEVFRYRIIGSQYIDRKLLDQNLACRIFRKKIPCQFRADDITIVIGYGPWLLSSPYSYERDQYRPTFHAKKK